MAWELLDTETWRLKVRRAKAGPEYKVPKEKSRVRIVELIDPAIHWIQKQIPWHDPPIRRCYTDLLVKAKVGYRGPDQCRHTFAS
ncbi:hypothetical protein [Marinobacterium nitratireducens]|uniref:hypothetical protein n=1 Tax=Marinobacterium nitratireducens TaxID=518897 RepID=UPI00166927AD|nr:hypothetical protein [Marinobacterium nitratireducens]